MGSTKPCGADRRFFRSLMRALSRRKRTANHQLRRRGVSPWKKFQNGSDPYRLFNTGTRGFKNMPSQTWMTPEQRYDVVQYVRESFVKKLTPSQYSKVDRAYLDLRIHPGWAREMRCRSITTGINFGATCHDQLLAGAWRWYFLDDHWPCGSARRRPADFRASQVGLANVFCQRHSVADKLDEFHT